MKRALFPMAVVLAGLYLLLAVMASACLFGHGEAHAGDHHHHGSQPAHSTLCVWACQANDGSSQTSAPPAIVLVLLSFGVASILAASEARVLLGSTHSRAPPR
ncbi:MAG: hypothetical protein KGO52_14045 [Nitrospirota bacterium]|nr:hypothetical protein [Nitrospirota bacterium]MDE3243832.1 hypothetical protein [Nitrospirota bacterium]